jgi:hypothetical protein
MQSNCNAGIIIYRETKVPQLLSAFAQPKLVKNIVIHDGIQDINITLFDCPVNGGKLDKKGYRLLRALVDQSKIKFLVERFETKVQSNVSPRKDEIDYSKLLREISAIKQFAALIRISQDREENLLAGNIGFIVGSIDNTLIDLLSDESSNIFYYEGPNLTEQLKTNLHNHFMEKKGVSIVFSKDITGIIKDSSIIVIDEGVDLKDYKELLNNKIVIGKSKDCGIRSIISVVLWHEELNNNKADCLESNYNDEILTIMRYYNVNLDTIDFIKRFPYIYLDYQ